ncbi:hypothetical protein MBM_09263 [Drepanopeziza brunnea f. sp. 'multigermtubi' MB_m1]|uniref:Uncharacterized protein n=1 Tax=Marssonina brunnea f. sp. multigermtubi (strain MB_m1) TaxID=1072389 RepID=K1XJW5_MARBU|nr:uncharacterized protein MBM_09263 [Drepanopeziza brunnea f. sp. 'multigermtubi' MB_m1]EKD12694.1 hypothetical protein MBM_09263 [Drepanopeziza brunnea f. sp. 'multigermtubi' MB_m1]
MRCNAMQVQVQSSSPLFLYSSSPRVLESSSRLVCSVAALGTLSGIYGLDYRSGKCPLLYSTDIQDLTPYPPNTIRSSDCMLQAGWLAGISPETGPPRKCTSGAAALHADEALDSGRHCLYTYSIHIHIHVLVLVLVLVPPCPLVPRAWRRRDRHQPVTEGGASRGVTEGDRSLPFPAAEPFPAQARYAAAGTAHPPRNRRAHDVSTARARDRVFSPPSGPFAPWFGLLCHQTTGIPAELRVWAAGIGIQLCIEVVPPLR